MSWRLQLAEQGGECSICRAPHSGCTIWFCLFNYLAW